MKNKYPNIRLARSPMLCAALIIASAVNAQIITYGWTNQTGGVTNDENRTVAIDAAGNVLTAGNYTDTVDFDPGPGTLYMSASGGSDFYVQKLSPTGALIWAKSFGGSEADYVNGIALDSSGNVFLTGGFSGLVDFDPSTAVYNLTSMPRFALDKVTQLSYKSDAYILKLDANGNFVWVKQLGGSGPDYGVAIAIDSSGNIISMGNCSDLRNFSDTIDVDPGPGVFNLIETGSYALNLTSSGDFVWAKGYGELKLVVFIGTIGYTSKSYSFSANDIATAINTNNIYLSGNFYGTVDFDSDGSSYNMSALGGSSIGTNTLDLAIIALKSNGDFNWAKQVGGPSSTASAKSIATDGLGNIIAAGTFSGIVDFDPDTSTYHISSFVSSGTPNANKPPDAFVLKLDSSGNYVFAKQIGGVLGDAINGLAIAPNNSIYATGSFSDICDFNPADTSTMNITSLGGIDAFVLNLDTAGEYQWVKRMGGIDDDEGNAIALIGLDVYTTGYFNAIVDFDPGNSVASFVSAGESDAFVQKLTDSTQYLGTNEDLPNDISVLTKVPYLYPNPAQNELHVELGQQIEDGTLSIVNLFGATLSHIKVLNQSEIILDISTLPSGAYLIVLTSNQITTVDKFLKN